jgi:serine/threonine protein kinase
MIPSTTAETLSSVPPPVTRESGAQPIPGYRLTQKIGRGWAGEVWECEAPGGLRKAIKFVPEIREALAGGQTGELEVIQQVKSIRHPFLLSMERVEFVGEDLAIITELADRSLQDVYQSYRQEGQPGIPRDQLLNYLREAAETLDLVNTQYGVQHLDIKPSNLFLVCNHVKIGDFGLACSLLSAKKGTGSQQAVTAYLAPEVLAGGMARQSDQYSLAVLYQELWTGTLPFHGTTAEELQQEHLRGQPNLEALPLADRSIVARALARDPNQRFSSCSDFIKALVFGHVEVGVVPSLAIEAARRDPPAAPAIPVGTPSRDQASANKSEPITYKLVRCLNRTALTEVWDIQTSNGRRVAKILFGPAGDNADALQRLLLLRHPLLAPLELGEPSPGRLVLISDPIQTSLRDHFQDCRTKGLPGIPREQLLGYLKTVAKGLTELYRQEGLQHLGLNPRNLFLVGDQVRLADFGIAQLLWLPVGETLSRMNPRYSAPELAQRKLSPACDQYSLALIYHELLTGQLPSTAGTSQPISLKDLQALPEAERTVIARALERDPEKRWESCRDLILALEGSLPKVVPVLPNPPIESALQPVPAAEVPEVEPKVEETVALNATEGAEVAPLSSSQGSNRDALLAAVTSSHEPTPIIEESSASPVAENVQPPAEPSQEAVAPMNKLTGFVSGLFRRPHIPEELHSPTSVAAPPAEPTEAPSPELTSSEEVPTAAPVAAASEPPSAASESLESATDPAQVILETRFGVNLSATTVRHRLDGVRRHWSGREVRRNDENLVFLMMPPRSYWQRWSAQQVALEVHIHLQEAPPLVPAPTEVAIAVMVVSGSDPSSEPVAKVLSQILLDSIRGALQVEAKGRGQERLVWPHPLKMWPVHAGGRLGEPVDCQGKDLSLNGIGFYLRGDPPPKVIRLQLPKTEQTPAMTVPARVVRVQPMDDGWHEVGAILLMR